MARQLTRVQFPELLLSCRTRAALFRLVLSEFCVSQTSEVRRQIHQAYRRGHHVLTNSSPAGNLRSLNDLAKSARADYIIHTGDFGFYDDSSLERIAEKWVVTPNI